MSKPKLPSIKVIAELVNAIKKDVDDECRAYEDDDTPGILLTVGASGKSSKDWGYQTGDTSYSGAAYFYSCWGQAAVHKDSNSRELAKDILREIQDCWYQQND